MIIIQLLLLGAVCATAWYIIKDKEYQLRREKSWSEECFKARMEWFNKYNDELSKNLKLRLELSDLKKKYGLNKISKKATEKKLHQFTSNRNTR